MNIGTHIKMRTRSPSFSLTTTRSSFRTSSLPWLSSSSAAARLPESRISSTNALACSQVHGMLAWSADDAEEVMHGRRDSGGLNGEG